MTGLPADWQRYAEALDRLQRLSQTMLRAAEHGDWAELLPLDGRRLLLMRDTAMPAGEPGAELTRLLRDRLETILNLNERLLALGATRCRDLSHRIHRLSEGRAALRAYAENSD